MAFSSIKRFRNIDLTKGDPLKQILLFWIPLLISGLLQQFYGIVDAAVVGRFCGLSAFSAIGATGSVTFFHLGAIMNVATGAAVITSQRFGAKDRRGVRRSFASSFIVGIGSAILLTAIIIPLVDDILVWMKFPAETHADAGRYLYCIFGGSIATAFYNTVFCQARSIGDSIIPLMWLIVSTIINVILDILFVAYFGWGVVGVGMATIAATIIAAIGGMVTLWQRYPILRLRLKDWSVGRAIILRQLGVGVPMALQSALTASGLAVRQSALNSLGTVVIAAHSAAVKVEVFLNMPIYLIGNVIATYAAQNYGAKLIDRLHDGVRKTALMLYLYSAIATAIAITFYVPLTKIFLSNPSNELLSYIFIYYYSITPFYILLSGLVIYRSVLQGTNHQIVPLIGGFISFSIRSFLAYPLLNRFGYPGVVFTEALNWIAVFALDYIYYRVSREQTR